MTSSILEASEARQPLRKKRKIDVCYLIGYLISMFGNAMIFLDYSTELHHSKLELMFNNGYDGESIMAFREEIIFFGGYEWKSQDSLQENCDFKSTLHFGLE